MNIKNKKRLLILCIIILIILIALRTHDYLASHVGTVDINVTTVDPIKIFTDYFGENKSYKDVKNLLSEIRSNNISNIGRVWEKVYVAFGKYGEELQIIEPKELSDMISEDKKYWIGIVNDNHISDDNINEVETEVKVDSEGYYSNGHIRLITIYEK